MILLSFVSLRPFAFFIPSMLAIPLKVFLHNADHFVTRQRGYGSKIFFAHPENTGLFQKGSAFTTEEMNGEAEPLRGLWRNHSAVK
jgi:hypothetical protein